MNGALMFGMNPQAWLAEHRRTHASLMAAAAAATTATASVVTAVAQSAAAGCTELACC